MLKLFKNFSRLESSAPSSNLLIIPTKEGTSRPEIVKFYKCRSYGIFFGL
jgi:hypothetical protein